MDRETLFSALERILFLPELTLLDSVLATELYLVGGTVRDAIAGVKPKGDFDLAANLAPDEILARLNKAGIPVIPTGLKHQTVMAVFPNSKLHVEITSLREKKQDGTIGVGTSIVEDLKLRDFTINALAFSFKEKALLDPLGGAVDIENKIIRSCNEPLERIKEDPLRALRAIRLASTLGYQIEPLTADAVKQSVGLLNKVSTERIRDEIEKILVGPRPRVGLELLLELNLLELCLPEIMPSVNCAQNRFHSADVFVHTLDVIDRTRDDLILRLSALFHDIGKPHTITIDEVTGDRHFFKHETVGAEITTSALSRLKFSNDINDATTALVRLHMRPTDCGVPGLRRLIRDTGELYLTWRELKEADTLATNVNQEEFIEHLKEFDERIAEIKKGPELSPLSALALKGKDLMAMGIPESPIIGVILRHLHEKVLDNPEINTKESLSKIIASDFANELK